MPSHGDDARAHRAALVAAIRPPIGARRPPARGDAHARRGIAGVGVDLLEVARLAREIQRDRSGFVRMVFLPAEAAYCMAMRYPERHLAARFAAKEAVFKALGLERVDFSAWRDVEIRSRRGGSRRVVLHGRLGRLAARRGVRRAWLSMTHTPSLAAAGVILES